MTVFSKLSRYYLKRYFRTSKNLYFITVVEKTDSPSKQTSEIKSDKPKKWSNFRETLRLCLVIGLCYYLFDIRDLFRVSGFGIEKINSYITFDEIKGCDEVINKIEDMVHFLKYYEKYENAGAKLPRGLILHGEPGVGKTLIAKAIAGEANVPFYYISGGSIEGSIVGMGSMRIRYLFQVARSNRPCVVFIDEIDSICSKRSDSPLHPYANQTSNQFFSEMDGLKDSNGILIIGATNKFKELDPAAIRSGRFSKHIEVGLPDYLGRIDLLKLYLGKVKASSDINLERLAHSIIGYNGAQIANIVNQAALKAASRNSSLVEQCDIEEAITMTSLGSVRDSNSSYEQLKRTAYHEAGHTVVAYFSEKSPFDINSVTILPRGDSGGHTSFLLNKEYEYFTKPQYLSMLDSSMGGRAGEYMMFGKDSLSSGVSNDMERATQIAREMVQELGMSDNNQIGLRVIGSTVCSYCHRSMIGQKLANQIDVSINSMLHQSLQRAIKCLQDNEVVWKKLAEYLIKYEYLTSEEVTHVLKGGTLNK